MPPYAYMQYLFGGKVRLIGKPVGAIFALALSIPKKPAELFWKFSVQLYASWSVRRTKYLGNT